MLERLKALWAKIQANVKSMLSYAGAKINAGLDAAWSAIWSLSFGTKLFIGSVISILLAIKFQDFLLDFILSNSKKLMNKTTAKDQELAAKEDANVKAAQSLEDQADALVVEKPVVTEDWNKK